jgi:hypothetical protein
VWSCCLAFACPHTIWNVHETDWLANEGVIESVSLQCSARQSSQAEFEGSEFSAMTNWHCCEVANEKRTDLKSVVTNGGTVIALYINNC